MIPVIPDGTKLIISYHNYDRTPALSVLKKIVQKMCTGTGIRCPCRWDVGEIWAIKIATKIVEYEDLLVHCDLQDWMKLFRSRKPWLWATKQIVLGMGDMAHYSRITSPMRNALTYTFLAGTDAAAPGQLPLSMYKIIQGSGYLPAALIHRSQIAFLTIHNFRPFRRITRRNFLLTFATLAIP